MLENREKKSLVIYNCETKYPKFFKLLNLIGRTIKAIGYGVDNGFQQSGAGIKRTVDLTIRSAETNYFNL